MASASLCCNTMLRPAGKATKIAYAILGKKKPKKRNVKKDIVSQKK